MCVFCRRHQDPRSLYTLASLTFTFPRISKLCFWCWVKQRRLDPFPRQLGDDKHFVSFYLDVSFTTSMSFSLVSVFEGLSFTKMRLRKEDNESSQTQNKTKYREKQTEKMLSGRSRNSPFLWSYLLWCKRNVRKLSHVYLLSNLMFSNNDRSLFSTFQLWMNNEARFLEDTNLLWGLIKSGIYKKKTN